MSELKDMRVVITGASSGFGSVAAKLLVDHGCKVTLGARREDRLKDLVKELGDLSVYEATDVKKKEDLDRLCLLYTSPSPRDYAASRMPSSA